MTAFSRAAVEAQRRIGAKPCTVRTATLTPAERKELVDVLADATVPVPAIRRALLARKLDIGLKALYGHRTTGCAQCGITAA